MTTSPIAQRLTPWIVPLALIAVWQVSAATGWLPTRVLPAPLRVVDAGVTLAEHGEIFRDIGVSAERAFAGLAIGGTIGFALGLLNGLFAPCSRLFDSTLQMVRNVPHLALIPPVILWFGIGEPARLFLVAIGAFF